VRLHAGADEECETEGVVETRCFELTTSPIPCPPVPLTGEEVEKVGNEVEHGENGRLGEVF